MPIWKEAGLDLRSIGTSLTLNIEFWLRQSQSVSVHTSCSNLQAVLVLSALSFARTEPKILRLVLSIHLKVLGRRITFLNPTSLSSPNWVISTQQKQTRKIPRNSNRFSRYVNPKIFLSVCPKPRLDKISGIHSLNVVSPWKYKSWQQSLLFMNRQQQRGHVDKPPVISSA